MGDVSDGFAMYPYACSSITSKFTRMFFSLIACELRSFVLKSDKRETSDLLPNASDALGENRAERSVRTGESRIRIEDVLRPPMDPLIALEPTAGFLTSSYLLGLYKENGKTGLCFQLPPSRFSR